MHFYLQELEHAKKTEKRKIIVHISALPNQFKCSDTHLQYIQLGGRGKPYSSHS